MAGSTVGFLDRNHTFMGSFFPFMVTGPRYSKWNWGSAFSEDCRHLRDNIWECVRLIAARQVIKSRICLPEGELRHVYSALFTGRFCAAGEIDCISEEAVSRHPLPDHPRHHLPGVDPNRDLEGRNDPHITRDFRIQNTCDIWRKLYRFIVPQRERDRGLKNTEMPKLL